ncbi:hypothetical protein DL769_010606 [Monosporascus sp. CRB-8-3]|nr:hypothetical protein DL769_010606 [Monosporascus sp. CRB-8-3]
MAFAATLGAFTEELVEIVTTVSAQSDPERFDVLKESALRQIRHHNFLRTNHFHVRNELDGLEERFRILNRDALADALRGRLGTLAQFSNKWTPEMLHFLLQLSDQPTQKSKLHDLELLKVLDEDLESPLTWEDVAKEDGWDQDRDLWKNVDFADGSSDGGYVDTKSDASEESEDTSLSSVEMRYREQPTDYLATIRDEDQNLKTAQEPSLQFENSSAFGPGSFTPFSEIFNNTFENWMQSKHHAAASTLRQALFESYNLWSVLDDLRHVYLMCNGSQSDTFAFSIFSNIDLLNSKWHDRFGLTEVAREAYKTVLDADRIAVTVAEEHRQSVAHELLWFCSSLKSYLTTLVIGPLMTELGESLQQAADIDDLAAVHSTIMKRMIDEACLGSKLDLIHQCILDILDLTIRLEDARQQESERAEEMKEISRLSMISSPRRSKRGRYIQPSEEEDESFLAEQDRSVLIQDAEKTYADVLVEIGAELDRHLKFMCGGLRGAARASGKDAAVKWDTLAEMLEVGVVQDRGRFNTQLYA